MKHCLLGGIVLGFLARMTVWGVADSPYGVCAHVSFDSEYRMLEDTCRTAADIGFGTIRTDFRADEIAHEAGRFEFGRYDRILSVAEKHGLQILPMLGYSVPWAKPARLHLEDMWLPFVSNVVARYLGRFPAVEIWNEENSGLWGETPNAADYLPLLRRSSATVKAVDPSVKVAIGGLSGVPIAYLRQIYEGGGKDAFDIMNIHPYSFPRPPEGDLDRRLDELRALMSEFGDADKEIWMTEFGWPTPEPGLDVPGLMRTGIRTALPDVAHPRVAYLDMGERGDVNPKGVLKSLRGELTEAQTVVSIGVSNVLAVADLRTRYDVLVLPFAEVFPDEALDALDRFVTEGGVLVDFGCMPFSKLGRERFRIETKSIWVDKRYPRAQSFADADRQAAGFSFPKYPRAAYTFFTDGWLTPGDSFCPLVKRVKGDVDVVPAAVYRFADRKGAILVSGYLDQNVVVASEDLQAEYAVRANLIAFAKGVKRTFWYELASAERDGRDPESHFGLCSRALCPKKSARAYAEFIRMRPSGSEQLSGLIRSKDGRRFATRWRRPDGTVVLAYWALDRPVRYRELRARRLTAFRPGEVCLGGEIGERQAKTVDKMLHHTGIDATFVKPFRDRATTVDGPGVFCGYGIFLDALVKAAAHGIGGRETVETKTHLLKELPTLQTPDGRLTMFKDKDGLWDPHENAYMMQACLRDYFYFGTKSSLETAKRIGDAQINRKVPGSVGSEMAFVLLAEATGDRRYYDWLEGNLMIRADIRTYDPIVYSGCQHVYTWLGRAHGQECFALLDGAADLDLADLCAAGDEAFRRTRGPHMSISGTITGRPRWGELWDESQMGIGSWGETCSSAYLMRLSALRTTTDVSSRFGDLYERILFNALFSAQSSDGLKYCYFTPFNEVHTWFDRDTFCCPNNFKRAIFEASDAVFFRSADGLVVNLYTPAVLKSDGVEAKMMTEYPSEGGVALDVRMEKGLRNLTLRIPAWCKDATVTVSGGSGPQKAASGWYTIERDWSDGGHVDIDLPMPIRFIRGVRAQEGYVAVMRGPCVYALDPALAKVRAFNCDPWTIDPSEPLTWDPTNRAVTALCEFDNRFHERRRLPLTRFCTDERDKTYFRTLSEVSAETDELWR